MQSNDRDDIGEEENKVRQLSQQSSDGFLGDFQWKESPVVLRNPKLNPKSAHDIQDELNGFKTISEKLFKDSDKRKVTYSLTQQITDFKQDNTTDRFSKDLSNKLKRNIEEVDQLTTQKSYNGDPYDLLLSSKRKQDTIILDKFSLDLSQSPEKTNRESLNTIQNPTQVHKQEIPARSESTGSNSGTKKRIPIPISKALSTLHPPSQKTTSIEKQKNLQIPIHSKSQPHQVTSSLQKEIPKPQPVKEDQDSLFTAEDLDLIDQYEELALSQQSISKSISIPISSNTVHTQNSSKEIVHMNTSGSLVLNRTTSTGYDKYQSSITNITSSIHSHPSLQRGISGLSSTGSTIPNNLLNQTINTSTSIPSSHNNSSISLGTLFTPIKNQMKTLEVPNNPLSSVKSTIQIKPVHPRDSFDGIDFDELDRIEQNAIRSLELSQSHSNENPSTDFQSQGTHLYGKIVEILPPNTRQDPHNLYNLQISNTIIDSIEFFIEDLKESHKLYHIVLKDDWIKVQIEVNATVNIIFDSFQTKIPDTLFITNTQNWMVIYPDELLTTTSISASYPCIRKIALSGLYQGNIMTNIYLLKGTMKHDLFEYAASLPLTSQLPLQLHSYILDHLDDYVSSISYLNLSLTDVYLFLHSIIPSILQFKYYYSFSNVEIPLLFQNSTLRQVVLEHIIKVEDNIWSPLWGIKGVVDIALSVSIKNERNQIIKLPLPLEIKTGSSNSSNSISHTAQVLLYTLLMHDHYGLTHRNISTFTDQMNIASPAGILLYISEIGVNDNNPSQTISIIQNSMTEDIIKEEMRQNHEFNTSKNTHPPVMITKSQDLYKSKSFINNNINEVNHTIPQNVIYTWNRSIAMSSLLPSVKSYLTWIIKTVNKNHLKLHGILQGRNELRSLLIRRNEIARWISIRKNTYTDFENQINIQKSNCSMISNYSISPSLNSSFQVNQEIYQSLDIEDLYKSPSLPPLEVVHSCNWCDSSPICLLFYLCSLNSYCWNDIDPSIVELIKKTVPHLLNKKYIAYFKKWYSLLSIEQSATMSTISSSFWNYTSEQRHEEKLGIGSLYYVSIQRCIDLIRSSSSTVFNDSTINTFYHVHPFLTKSYDCVSHNGVIYCFEYEGAFVNLEPSIDSRYIISSEVGDYALAYVYLIDVIPDPSNIRNTDQTKNIYYLYVQAQREFTLSDNRDISSVCYRLDRTEGFDKTDALISNVVHFLTQVQVNGESKTTQNSKSQHSIHNSQNQLDYSYPNVSKLRAILVEGISPSISSYPLTLDDYISDRKKNIKVLANSDPDKYLYYNSILLHILPLLAKLNNDQLQCLLLCLRSNDICLVQGMPGCGKTFLISLLIALLVINDKKICISSHTHNSIDNVLLKVQNYGIHMVRLGDIHKVHPSIRPYTLDFLLYSTSTESNILKRYNEIFQTMSIVGCTVYTDIEFITRNINIDVCIIDEAGQIMEPAVLPPILCCTRSILVGDSKQLPPLVHSTLCNDRGLNVSLMRRLEIQAKNHHNTSYIGVLKTQYRMNNDIMGISNQLIYNNKMIVGNDSIAKSSLKLNLQPSYSPSYWLYTVLNPLKSVVFLNTDTIYSKNVLEEKQGEVGSESLFNRTEAKIVEIMVHSLLDHGVLCNDIGVISQYSAQINYIESDLKEFTCLHKTNIHKRESRLEIKDCLLEVSTVDKFQGRDKDCIIISLVRSNESNRTGKLLKSWRRMNVAFTRAKKKLIVCGSVQLLSQVTIWKQFLELVQSEYSYIDLTLQDIKT